MKFEIGKEYLTKDGTKALCIYTKLKDTNFPNIFIVYENPTGVVYRYSNSGVCMDHNFKYSEYKIISENKPIINWNEYPRWIKAFACNGVGKWYAFDTIPTLKDFEWISDGISIEIPQKYAPEWSGNWIYSLVISKYYI